MHHVRVALALYPRRTSGAAAVPGRVLTPLYTKPKPNLRATSASMTSHPPPALPVLDAHYVLVDTIVGFEDSVNCLQFNETADLLAIGCDDGRFRILEIEDGALVLKFRIVNVAVTSLLWHPEEVNTIFVGYSDGGIVQCVVDPMDRQVSLVASYALDEKVHLQSGVTECYTCTSRLVGSG